MALRAVIFDSDGVLVNTEELAARAEASVLGQYGMICTPASRLPRLTGQGLEQHKAMLAGDFKNAMRYDMPATVFPDFLEVYRHLVDHELSPVAGARDLILMLKRHGVPFAIASNSRLESLEHKLKKSDLYNLFDPRHIHGKTPGLPPKPSPAIYIAAAHSLGRRPEECIVVDDSPMGVQAGCAAGSYVIGFAGLEHIIRDQSAMLRKAGAHEAQTDMEILGKRVNQLLSVDLLFSGPRL